MKKFTILAALLGILSSQAQEVLFEDDFESYDDFAIDNVGDWTLIDLDLRPTYIIMGTEFPNGGYTGAFIVFNSTATSPPLENSDYSNWDARSGEKAMTSIAATPGGSGNNDWLISPQITLGSSGNMLTFWAKATDADYFNEKFHVGISTTDTDPESFTQIATDLVPQAIEWQEFTFNLDDYAGQAIHIAINHVASDQFGFQVDDFKVETGVLGTEDISFKNFNHYIANDKLNLSANNTIDKVVIYNMAGQEIISEKLYNNMEAIDISGLNQGVYLTSVFTNGKIKTFKIVKK